MAVYTVLGARGGTGVQLLKQLLESEDVKEVRAVVRDPSKAALPDDVTENEKLKLMQGDVAKADTLRAAMEGSKGVFFAASGRNYEECRAVDMDGVGDVAKLAKELEVGRVVLVSSMLVHPSNRFHFVRGILNTIKGAWFHRRGLMDFKFEGEQRLRASGQEYCVVRPGRLCDTQKDQDQNRGRAKLIVDQTNAYLGSGGHETTRADVAAVCILAMTAEETKNTTFELASEKALPKTEADVPKPTVELFSKLQEKFDSEWPERINGKKWENQEWWKKQE